MKILTRSAPFVGGAMLSLAALAASSAACAQTSPSATDAAYGNRYSMLPYTRSGYVGINLGSSDYDTPCGSVGGCDNTDLAGKIYTGGMINRYLGVELGYLHMGEADRAGG